MKTFFVMLRYEVVDDDWYEEEIEAETKEEAIDIAIENLTGDSPDSMDIYSTEAQELYSDD